MHAVFQLKPGEPNASLFDYLRNLLLQQPVEITVRTLDTNGAEPDDDDSGYPNGAHYADDTEYLFSNPANKKFLEEQMRKVESGEAELVTFTLEEFEKYSDQLMAKANASRV